MDFLVLKKHVFLVGFIRTINLHQGERFYLLEDDNQCHLVMEEAAVSNSAASLCSLFAVILTWCEPNNPLDIYQHHKESINSALSLAMQI